MNERYLVEDYTDCSEATPDPVRLIFTNSPDLIKFIGAQPKEQQIVVYPIDSHSIIDWRKQ